MSFVNKWILPVACAVTAYIVGGWIFNNLPWRYYWSVIFSTVWFSDASRFYHSNHSRPPDRNAVPFVGFRVWSDRRAFPHAVSRVQSLGRRSGDREGETALVEMAASG